MREESRMRWKGEAMHDLRLLLLHTALTGGLYVSLYQFYMPSVGTPWEALMFLTSLLTFVMSLLWVIFLGVYVNCHILKR